MTGIRLHFIVEGQTEETFVNQVLKPHLGNRYVWADARCVQTSRRGAVSSIAADFETMRCRGAISSLG